MGTAIIREKLHDYIGRADDRLLNLIYAMMQADLDELELNEKQELTLDKRIASHQENPSAGSKWEDVKERIKRQL